MSGSSSSSSVSEGGDGTDLWWFHTLDAALYFFLFVGVVVRSHRRWKEADTLTSIGARRFRAYLLVSLTLGAYAVSRTVVEGIIASNVVDSFGSFEYEIVSSVPGVLFAASQTALLARWVGTVGAVVSEFRRSRIKVATIATISSCVLAGGFVALLITATVDHETKWFNGALDDDDWVSLLNAYEGTLYIFNGVSFILTGAQLAFYWSKIASQVSSSVTIRIVAIAVVFASLCISRGALLCVGGAAQQSQELHVMLTYSFAPPLVLVVEWICLVLCFFILQPQRESLGRVAPGGGSAFIQDGSTAMQWVSNPETASNGAGCETPRAASFSPPRVRSGAIEGNVNTSSYTPSRMVMASSQLPQNGPLSPRSYRPLHAAPN